MSMPWSEYLNAMAQNSIYGDQLTLQAMVNLYLVKITVISNLGPEGRTVIRPQNCDLVAWVFLGHFSGDEGAWSLVIEIIKKVTKRNRKYS